MQRSLSTFRASLQRVRSIHVLHVGLDGKVAAIIDLSDLLRAEIVLAVSALDQFIHELARVGILEVWGGKRSSTQAYSKFPISIDAAKNLAENVGGHARLDTEIRIRHSFLAFQQPDKIADAVRLFSSVELWSGVGALLKTEPSTVKAKLKLLVERRNKIAHEADIDPSYPDQRWPISREDAEDALALVEEIGEAIYRLVA